MKAFQPAATKGKLAFLFTISEMGAESRGKPVAALAVESCDTIWSDDKSELLLPRLNHPRSRRILILELCFYSFTSATVGGLTTFCVLRQMGKDSGLSAKLTASAAIAHQLGSEGFDPVIMVNKHQGGRGYAYEICASYKMQGRSLSVSI